MASSEADREAWGELLGLAPPPAEESDEPRRRGLFRRLRDNLTKPRQAISPQLAGIFAPRLVTEDTWEELEEALISADCGTDVTLDLVERLRGYLRDLEAGKATVAGWKVNVGKNTLDPCWVVPRNKVTAALYTYTPWVGASGQQCGRKDVGGSSLVALLYHKFKSEYPWRFSLPPDAGLSPDRGSGSVDAQPAAPPQPDASLAPPTADA